MSIPVPIRRSSRSAAIALMRHGLPALLIALLAACNELGERKIAPDAGQVPDTGAPAPILPKAAEPVELDPEVVARANRIRSARMIDARRLGKEYLDNGGDSERKFKERDLIVAGAVDSLGRDLLGRAFVTVGDASRHDLLLVRCYFSTDMEDQIASLQPGQYVYVLGVCKGRVFQVMVEDCEWLDQTELASFRGDLISDEPKLVSVEEPRLTPAQERAAQEKAERERIEREKAEADLKSKKAAEKTVAEKEQLEQRAAAGLKLIKALIEQGRVSAAKKSLMTLINDYPKTIAAEQARRILLDLQ